MKFVLWTLLCFVLPLFAVGSGANESSLYKTPPPGSSFVRLFNSQADRTISSVSLGKKSLAQIIPGKSSDFVFVDAKQASINIDKVDYPVALVEGRFFDLIFDGKTVRTVEISALKDKRKGLIHLVNLTELSIDLKTVKGDVNVVPSVVSFGAGDRAINPVKLAFSVYSGEKQLLTTDEIYLDRGQSGTLFIFTKNGVPSSYWTQDQLAADK